MPESSEPTGAPAETPAEPGGGDSLPATGDQPTQLMPPTGDQPAVEAAPEPAAGAQPQPPDAARPVVARDLPAGVDPGELELAPIPSAGRGKLRRRLRYLRNVRELLLRDLGGFAYELDRTMGGTPHETQRKIAASKAERITALDVEVRGLESRLAEPHAEALLREPGIGGTCPECGELHASDARFCSRCGTPLDARALAQRDAAIAAAAAAQPTTGSHALAEPGPASVLWAAGPRPSGQPEAQAEPATADPEEPHLAPATSEWLLGHDQPTAVGEPVDQEAVAEAPAAPEPVAQAEEPPAPEPAAQADEPPAEPEDVPAAAEEPPAPAAEEEPAPAKPKRAPRPRKPAADEAEQRPDFDANPNGSHKDDVPPPSGDPLGSRGEERS